MIRENKTSSKNLLGPRNDLVISTYSYNANFSSEDSDQGSSALDSRVIDVLNIGPSVSFVGGLRSSRPNQAFATATIQTGSRESLVGFRDIPNIHSAVEEVKGNNANTNGRNNKNQAPAEEEEELEVLRVLIVDDSSYNLFVMEELIGQIKTKKILLDTALNGQLAVDQVIETWRGGNAYDVIFLDLNMPVLDGFQVTLSKNL